MPRVHDKEDDSKGKHVNNLALIWLLRYNLRSHVAMCAKTNNRSIEGRAVVTLKRAGRVNKNLKVILLVEEDVLWLQISVREAPLVHVMDAL